MPIYEYRCADCKKRVSVFFRSFSVASDPACPNCGSKNLKRALGRVRVARSEESRLESLADPSSLGDVDENDPKSVAKFMRKMGDQMGGEDLGPEFGEMVERLESGESPEEIEKTMPGLAGGEGAGEMGDL